MMKERREADRWIDVQIGRERMWEQRYHTDEGGVSRSQYAMKQSRATDR